MKVKLSNAVSTSRTQTEFEDAEMSESISSRRTGIKSFATGLCVVVVALFAVDFVLHPERFQTKNVNIVGDLSNTTSNQIISAISQVADSNILLVDMAEAAAAAQSLPWVENATIRRKWPDTIEVRISERVIQARWNGSQFLDQIGTPVELPEYEDETLPLLSGPQGSSYEVLEKYRIWDRAASSVDLRVVGVNKSARGSWELVVESQNSVVSDDGVAVASPVQILFGGVDIYTRTQRFLRVYQGVFKPVHHKLEVVDLRHPDGVAVTWKDDFQPRLQGIATINKS